MDARSTLIRSTPVAPPKPLRIGRLSSPIGALLLVTGDDGALRALDFDDYESRMHRLLRLHTGSFTLSLEPTPDDIARALTNYFSGDLHAIDTTRVDTGGTAFQRDMWTVLRGVPSGTTTTYGRIAAQLGRPRATRAVGAANGANPIAIVVPCHRVIGANGALTGYGGGIARKRWLLDHERANMTSDVIA